MKNLVIDTIGEYHERMATNIIVDIANTGGLIEIAFVFCWLAYLLFHPIKEVDLALSFGKLGNDSNKNIYQLEKDLNCCFYLKLIFYQRISPCLHWLLCLDENETEALERIEHFEN